MIETPEELVSKLISTSASYATMEADMADIIRSDREAIRTECAERAKFITFEEAEKRARSTDYAWDAAEQEINPINWPDASGFYFEGYSRAVRDIKAAIMAEPEDATR